jgi:hypothetical protein
MRRDPRLPSKAEKIREPRFAPWAPLSRPISDQ